MANIEDIFVNDTFDHTQKWTSGIDYDKFNAGELDLSELDIVIDIINGCFR